MKLSENIRMVWEATDLTLVEKIITTLAVPFAMIYGRVKGWVQGYVAVFKLTAEERMFLRDKTPDEKTTYIMNHFEEILKR